MTDLSSTATSSVRAASDGAPPLVGRMNRLAEQLARDPRLEHETVTRPHPLIVGVARDELLVVVAPAAVWDGGKELLRPFAARFADATAMLILVGVPQNVDL